MAKNGMKKYQATYLVTYNQGYEQENRRRTLQVKAPNYDAAGARVSNQLASIRSQPTIKGVSLERIVEIG